MFCIILCSHRVWNLNPSPAVDISHKSYPAVNSEQYCNHQVSFLFVNSNNTFFRRQTQTICKQKQGTGKRKEVRGKRDAEVRKRRIQPAQVEPTAASSDRSWGTDRLENTVLVQL